MSTNTPLVGDAPYPMEFIHQLQKELADARAEIARLEALIVNDAGTGWKQKAQGYLRQLHECNNASAAEAKDLVLQIFDLQEQLRKKENSE